MIDRDYRLSRRKFIASAAALAVARSADAEPPREAPDAGSFLTRPTLPSTKGRKPLAVLTTVYRPLSHSYHLAGRFIHGYYKAGKPHLPAHFVHSLYAEQKHPDNDLSRDHARDFGFHLARSIPDALTAGTDKLAVEGVLLIAEHGNYERNDKLQILYPRFEYLEQVVAAFKKTGQTVPVFCDKHLSHSFAKAKQMVEWSRELKFPLMAGSSLPVTWRRPELELKLDSPVEEALVAAYGPIEVYGIHALEALQAMIERRKGGETGVKAVTCLTGNDVWKAGDAGKWSWSLLEAALRRSETVNPGDIRKNTGSMGVLNHPATPATAFLVEYRDGTRGTALLLNGHLHDFVFAARIKAETRPASCLFYLPEPPGAKFLEAQAQNIEKLLVDRKAPYPVERTLLTTGILDAALTSHKNRGERVETPELEISYTAPADSGFVRGSPAADQS